MLYIKFIDKDTAKKDIPNLVWHIDGYFYHNYEEEWFQDNLVKEMIRDVDGSDEEHRSGVWLSDGLKALILMLKEPELVVYASNCGTRCIKWVLKIAEKRDIHIALDYEEDIMCFKDSQFYKE